MPDAGDIAAWISLSDLPDELRLRTHAAPFVDRGSGGVVRDHLGTRRILAEAAHAAARGARDVGALLAREVRSDVAGQHLSAEAAPERAADEGLERSVLGRTELLLQAEGDRVGDGGPVVAPVGCVDRAHRGAV